MDLLDKYESTKQKLFDYFGYTEDWVIIPLDDGRDYFWKLLPDHDDEADPQKVTGGFVRFAESVEILDDKAGDYFENEIYTQRFLPKWVYEGEDYTMVCVNPRVDGNKFLMILTNDKRQPDGDPEETRAWYRDIVAASENRANTAVADTQQSGDHEEWVDLHDD